jgi:hypothetical protein
MGGAVPNDGGLTLDLSRLDTIEFDPEARVCVIGAGARLRTIHTKLSQRGMALTNYPSNLGGTLVGWFVTGGIGLNAFGRGRALDGVKAADLLLPSGEHLRFHDDGRLDVPDGKHRKTLSAAETEAWFRARNFICSVSPTSRRQRGTQAIDPLTVEVEARRAQRVPALFDDAAQAQKPPGAGRDADVAMNMKFFSARICTTARCGRTRIPARVEAPVERVVRRRHAAQKSIHPPISAFARSRLGQYRSLSVRRLFDRVAPAGFASGRGAAPAAARAARRARGSPRSAKPRRNGSAPACSPPRS